MKMVTLLINSIWSIWMTFMWADNGFDLDSDALIMAALFITLALNSLFVFKSNRFEPIANLWPFIYFKRKRLEEAKRILEISHPSKV